MQKYCYMCGADGSTREHVPPRCFFPKGVGHQELLTVRSCPKHNTGKSNDDQYVLAQICINAGAGDNLAKQVFQRSVAPQLVRSPAFAARLRQGSKALPNGGRAYPVDMDRMNRFFDHFVHALCFAKYGRQVDPQQYRINHEYLSLLSDSAEERARQAIIVRSLGYLLASFSQFEERFEAATLTEPVYEYKLIAPAGLHASITIRHFFYGVFEVISLISLRVPNA